MVPAWHGAVAVIVGGLLAVSACAPREVTMDVSDHPGDLRPLPALEDHAPDSLEEAIATRRSVRDFAERAVSDEDIGRLLWAAQGITGPEGRRAAPSAGATYPLEVYSVSADGVARYLPEAHALEPHLDADPRDELAAAALGQSEVAAAPLVVVITGVVARTATRYGDRAERYVTLEAGHAAQNVLLQAVARDLAAVPIGAFDDDEVAAVLELPDGRAPLYLLPVGHPAG